MYGRPVVLILASWVQVVLFTIRSGISSISTFYLLDINSLYALLRHRVRSAESKR